MELRLLKQWTIGVLNNGRLSWACFVRSAHDVERLFSGNLTAEAVPLAFDHNYGLLLTTTVYGFSHKQLFAFAREPSLLCSS